MRESRLNAFDLNLLKVFAEIYQTRNITDAAKILDMTQSGVSRALQRMRSQLNDPLFIRAGGTLSPTPRAEQLGQSLPILLRNVADECFPFVDFDPLRYQGKINIVISGALIDVLGVPVVASLNHLFPNALVQLTHWSHGALDAFEQEEVVFGVSYSPLNINQNIRQKPVLNDFPVVLMRQDHPLQGIELTPEKLAESELSGMIITELSEYQTVLANRFKNTNFYFKLRSDHLPSIYHQIQHTDLLMFTLNFAMNNHPVAIKRVPINWKIPLPELSVALFYHQKYNNHPVYALLDKTIKQLVLDLKVNQ